MSLYDITIELLYTAQSSSFVVCKHVKCWYVFLSTTCVICRQHTTYQSRQCYQEALIYLYSLPSVELNSFVGMRHFILDFSPKVHCMLSVAMVCVVQVFSLFYWCNVLFGGNCGECFTSDFELVFMEFILDMSACFFVKWLTYWCCGLSCDAEDLSDR